MASKTVRTAKPHVALFVKNLQASLAFYQKLFGMAPARLRSGYAKFDVANPPLNFTLTETPYSVAPGSLSHLGLQVPTTCDVLETRDRWEKSGLVTRDEMNTNCCYAWQDKAWVRDPDGNEWEVFTVLDEDRPERGALQQEGDAPPCCSPTGMAAR